MHVSTGACGVFLVSLCMRTKIFAKAGEPIVCENFHVICTVVRDIVFADWYSPTFLGAWQQEEPKQGDTNPVCAK